MGTASFCASRFADYPGMGELVSLYLLPRCAGKGIGKALVAQAEVLAQDKGLSFIGLATGFQRTSAHAFYEKLGFESGSYWYNKML